MGMAPSWSTNRDHFSNLSFPLPKEVPYEMLSKIGSAASEKSFENVNRRTDDGQKVITIAYPEHSSGELKITRSVDRGMYMHYENRPIQIYRKYHLQKLKIFR